MQIPILQGIYTDATPATRTAYPVNLAPVPGANGVSNGYLKPAEGLVSIGTGPGADRGGINWNGVHYRVMGTKLVRVTSGGAVTTLGDVGGSGFVTLTYSFDRLAIVSGGNLYYWDGGALTQVTDADLGTALDAVWVDGYFMTTDGENLVVTELIDPTSVNPLKYGSSEVDPDPVKALLKLRNEVYALNRHTIEAFDNVGGDFFPFARIEGAQITKGVVGTHACCVYMDAIAFMGGGRNEPISIYAGANATANKISTHEIDKLLSEYSEGTLSAVKLEARQDANRQLLYVHLPDRSLVYDAAATQALQQPVWYTLTTSTADFEQYRARNFVFVHNAWHCGDPQSSAVGTLSDTVSTHWGATVRWEFATAIIYAAQGGAVLHELELVPLAGRMALDADPVISTSYSNDGRAWSQSKSISAGSIGDYAKRLVWRRLGLLRHWRIHRFTGHSDSHIAFMRLEAQIEKLGAA